jgi:hypothetical protein
MSSIAKSKISISKKDLSKSRILPVGSRNIKFYHKANANDITINLLSLSLPSAEMPTVVQATIQEIDSAKLLFNKKNLTLTSSAKGELIQGLDYIVTSSYDIQLIGSAFTDGADQDEIFVGTINSAPVSDLITASAKNITKTYQLPVSQTTLSLGHEYKVGVNPNDKVGIIKVYVNGVLALRDEDYLEVDSGNGYGSTIEFLIAPLVTPHEVVVDFGVMSITDNDALGTVESLAGSMKKIADDLAVVAGTSSEDYFNASPSDVERRVFGDTVLKLLDAEVPITTEWVSYTPTFTGFTSSTTISVLWRRVGDTLEVQGIFTPGSSSATTAQISLPSGLTIATNISTIRAVGDVVPNNVNSGQDTFTLLAASGNSFFNIGQKSNNNGNTAVNASQIPANGSITVSFRGSVKIQGWTATQTLRQQLGL